MKQVFINQDDPNWLSERNKYIGASEIACAMGLSKWKSARTLFLEKTGQIPKFEGNKRTELGHHMEPLLKQWFENETGHALRRKNAFCIHDEYEWMSCTLDFHIQGTLIPVEMKTTAFASDDWKSNIIPSEYFWQCQQQLMITDSEKMYIAVYIFQTSEFIIKEVLPDMAAMTAIRDLGNKFWDNLKNGIEPGIDWNDDSDDFGLEITEPVKKADLSAHKKLLVRREELKSLEKQIETELAGIDNTIKSSLEGFKFGVSDGYQIQWNRGESEVKPVFNQARFIQERPDIFKAYCDDQEVKKREYFRIVKKG